MHTVKEQKSFIDLADVIIGAGIELRIRGDKHTGLCPFHPDSEPSFFVFSDQHFKCFGCGTAGDVIDFVKQFYSMNFNQACRHLGIDLNGGKPLNEAHRRKVADKKRKQERRQARKKRERELAYTLGSLIRWTNKAKTRLTRENFDEYAGILDDLEYWEWAHDVLIHGNRLDRAYVLWSFKDFSCLKRNMLFDESFNYKKWLHDFLNGEPNDGFKRIEISLRRDEKHF